MRAKPVSSPDGSYRGLRFDCPGCGSPHVVSIPPTPGAWGFDGRWDAPTLTPSVLVRYNGADAGQPGAPPAVCHSFVRAGRIEFLADCTHSLAGKTVDLPEVGS